jgi:hypothetical protein
LEATPKHALPLRPCRQQFFALHFDDVPGFAYAALRFPHTAFELGPSHLCIGQFLATGFQFGAHFRQITLGLAHLSSERIHRQLEIDNLRFNDRFQLAATGDGKRKNTNARECHRSDKNTAPPNNADAMMITGVRIDDYHRL